MSDFEAKAGRLYFLIKDKLGFGHLTMYSDRPDCVTYSWTFTAKKQKCSGDWTCSREEFANFTPESLALRLSDLWREQGIHGGAK